MPRETTKTAATAAKKPAKASVFEAGRAGPAGARRRLSQPAPKFAHIVIIRSNAEVAGYQVRLDGGGAGRSKYFSVRKHGGAALALRAAQKMMRATGAPPTRKRGGSTTGRLQKTSRTGAPGIRFVWVDYPLRTVLTVIASWVDADGRNRSTSYSVEANGLEGALDKAIERRTSAGAPAPRKAQLLRLLRATYRTAPDTAGAA